MHLTLTSAQFTSIFFIVMIGVCMSYALEVMRMKTPPTFILLFAFVAELIAALFGYLACQLALQQTNQDLSYLDASIFIIAILLFCIIMAKGSKIWRRIIF